MPGVKYIQFLMRNPIFRSKMSNSGTQGPKIEKIEFLDIQTIAPCHGPAIETSWRSLLKDYQRWGDQQNNTSLKVALLFASAYGNTASIADSIAKGIS